MHTFIFGRIQHDSYGLNHIHLKVRERNKFILFHRYSIDKIVLQTFPTIMLHLCISLECSFYIYFSSKTRPFIPAIDKEPKVLEAFLIAHTPEQLQVSYAYTSPMTIVDIRACQHVSHKTQQSILCFTLC